jgi:selenocysteine lyase/cysteine desulfurase
MSSIYDVQKIRKQFPALERQINGQPAVYLDGPGGTQVPQRVADKVTEYLLHHNANAHGNFITSRESDALHESAREVMADFLGCHASEIMFGDSSSTNNFKLALALARDLEKGTKSLLPIWITNPIDLPGVILKKGAWWLNGWRLTRKTAP